MTKTKGKVLNNCTNRKGRSLTILRGKTETWTRCPAGIFLLISVTPCHVSQTACNNPLMDYKIKLMGCNQNCFLNETEWKRKYQTVLHIGSMSFEIFVPVMCEFVCTDSKIKHFSYSGWNLKHLRNIKHILFI